MLHKVKTIYLEFVQRLKSFI